ncbi:hypothetical protein BDM02DRAFT_3187988 [Thelephora ganbajun]|uniref:Uncharacterized protein n=1 Tax=Thelephora ganbajun TaxID=370292 RepID=A0ACB6ZCU9_THEGA|nr:hypothetical protein BDM02DRAFT_3187988 [Thelephora ganbajun]
MGESSVENGGSESGRRVQEGTGTPIAFRPEFYEASRRQAKVFDNELKDYNHELNVTLLFAALFAVVASTFLKLEESKQLLLTWDSRQASSSITTVVFCGLAASLLVAFLAIFAKSILKRYANLDFTAADPSRGRYRAPSAFHLFVPGIVGLFIEGLSLVLQAALLAVAYVLANHLWSQDQWAASLTIVGVEILCIVLITSATVGPALLGVSGSTVTKSIKKPLLRALISMEPNVKNFRQRTLPKRRPSALVSDDGKLEKLKIISDNDMFDRSIDSSEAAVVLDFITEVVWHSGIREVPLAKIFEIFDNCFDYSKGNATPIPRLRDRAYKAGRALVHLLVQRKCIGEEKAVPLEGLRGIRGSYSSCSYDNDLDSILHIVDRLFGTPKPINWIGYTFSESHRRWLSHILLYRAWDHLRHASKLPDDVEAFVAHAFSTEDTHPAIVADCLFIVSLVIGMPFHVDDLAVDDKSSGNETLYRRIFDKLESTFTNSVIQEYPRSLDAIRLIASLQDETIAANCYRLFRVILPSSLEEEVIWAAARFAINGAYKWDDWVPWVEDLDGIIMSLTYYFEIQAKGEDHIATQSIEDALRGVAYGSNETMLEDLKKLDHTNQLFVDGIRRAFKEDRPFRTQQAALFLMPVIQDQWFGDSSKDVMSDGEKDEFCKNWGSVVDRIEHIVDVKEALCATLFGMLNSKKWRSHIVKDKLKLMEYFADLPKDSEPFTACKKNASILPWLRSRVDERGEKGKRRPKDVRDQVLEVTKAVISGVRHDVSFISRVMAAEKERYQAMLDGHKAASLEDEPERLRAKVEGLNEGIEKFAQVVGEKAKQ